VPITHDFKHFNLAVNTHVDPRRPVVVDVVALVDVVSAVAAACRLSLPAYGVALLDILAISAFKRLSSACFVRLIICPNCAHVVLVVLVEIL